MIFFLLTLIIIENENQWSDKIAEQMGNCEREVRMVDGTRADIIDYKNLVTYEVDWDKKFYEGVGQSLYYSMEYSSLRKENFKPGVILLVRDPSELKYAFRASKLCMRLKIKLILVDTVSGIAYSNKGRWRVKNEFARRLFRIV
tara:strand:+ start:2626 stop:3057 length:432 start_codon:yes stop_codon:yes gene_type:complete